MRERFMELRYENAELKEALAKGELTTAELRSTLEKHASQAMALPAHPATLSAEASKKPRRSSMRVLAGVAVFGPRASGAGRRGSVGGGNMARSRAGSISGASRRASLSMSVESSNVPPTAGALIANADISGRAPGLGGQLQRNRMPSPAKGECPDVVAESGREGSREVAAASPSRVEPSVESKAETTCSPVTEFSSACVGTQVACVQHCG